VNVSAIMTSTLHTITSDKSVAHAAERMKEHQVDSLIVVDRDDVIGIMTSRDALASHPNRIVADAITQRAICLPAEQSIWDANQMIMHSGIEQFLIMEEDRLVGCVTKESIKLRIAGYTDPLTGLFRAPYIQAIGERLLKERTPFHLLFIDLNNFGQINKLYGHPFGNDVIREYSKLLSTMIDDQCEYLSRYAGDEFVIISMADEKHIHAYMDIMDNPIDIHNVQVSAAVGHVNGYLESDFFSLSLREWMERASLLSTSAKKVSASTAQ
jgi:diguanylate cyclase (GGDEF)-like protein